MDQARGMIERGHDIYFISRKDTETARFLAREGFQCEQWNPVKYIDIRAMQGVRSMVARTGADIVHVHHSADLALAFPPLLVMPQVKLIFSTYMYVPAPKKDIYHRMEYGRVDRVLTLSDPMSQNARANLPVPPDSVITMPYGICLDQFDLSKTSKGYIRNRFDIRNDQLIIGLVGRLDPFKGQMEMIRAMPAILERFPKAILALVGGETPEFEGVYKKKLEEEVRRAGVEGSVIFTGHAENTALPMADLDIYVIPSYHETFGMSAIEAMAMGLPVVASDTGGLPDVLDHGECGLLAKAKDPASFAEGVMKYLADGDLRKSMGYKGCVKAMEMYDRRKSMARLEGIYQDALGD